MPNAASITTMETLEFLYDPSAGVSAGVFEGAYGFCWAPESPAIGLLDLMASKRNQPAYNASWIWQFKPGRVTPAGTATAILPGSGHWAAARCLTCSPLSSFGPWAGLSNGRSSAYCCQRKTTKSSRTPGPLIRSANNRIRPPSA